YGYAGPDLSFEPPANWELVSARANASAAGGRRVALATSGNDVDVERLCQPAYAASLGGTANAVRVRGATCPIGCSALSTPAAAWAPSAGMLCAPAEALQIGPRDAACPDGTVDASADPAWAAWAT